MRKVKNKIVGAISQGGNHFKIAFLQQLLTLPCIQISLFVGMKSQWKLKLQISSQSDHAFLRYLGPRTRNRPPAKKHFLGSENFETSLDFVKSSPYAVPTFLPWDTRLQSN